MPDRKIQLGAQAVLRVVSDPPVAERGGEPVPPRVYHELLRNEERLWGRQLPVSLSHAALSEELTLVGQGYTEPRVPGARAPSYGCRIVMIRPDGTIGWTDDRERRRMPTGLDLPPKPEVLAISVHEKDDVARLYLNDFQNFRTVMMMWPYRLQTGEPLDPVRIDWPAPPPEGLVPLTARRIPGTPFDAVAFMLRPRAEREDPDPRSAPEDPGTVVVSGPSVCGLAVLLLAPDGEIVWTKELPGIFGSDTDEGFQFPDRDTVLDVDVGSFTVTSRGRALRTFHVSIDKAGKSAVIERSMPEDEERSNER